MQYYKAFDKDLICRNFKYEIGKTYTLDNNEPLELCKNGFHFCDILNNCYNYYPDNDDTIICLVEPLGNIISDVHQNKLATDKIKIVKRLTKEEIQEQRYIIQDGITFIGDDTFNGCILLKSIDIPNSVTYIGESIFCNSDLINVYGNKFCSSDLITIYGNKDSYAEQYAKKHNINFKLI